MSDIARVYAPAATQQATPEWVTGSAGANTAGVDQVEQAGKENATVKNGDLARSYGDLAR